MKATLKFDLPEEIEEFNLCSKAGAFHFVVNEFENWLRNEIKHGNRSDHELKTLEEVQTKFYEITQDI